ncbi:MAG: hypothetical protein LC117_04035 [Bacteroidia bacterium]|nr:hypothetical protein [Bacteroidia bacterium]MCZ2277078.1 hypothetical protein [Bacteroidia bacterium]
MKKKLALLTLVISGFCLQLKSQEVVKPLKVNIELAIDENGNAQATYQTKLNAGQWDAFKRSMGNNQSLLKRSIERSLPAYFLTDFKYEEDAMDRSYSLKFNAYGMCHIDASGKWVAELDVKNPDITKLDDNTYMIISEMVSGGQLIQANQKIIFPSSASDIKEEKDAFGKAIFTFKMSGSSATGKTMQYAGIGLLIIGAVLMWRASKS